MKSPRAIINEGAGTSDTPFSASGSRRVTQRFKEAAIRTRTDKNMRVESKRIQQEETELEHSKILPTPTSDLRYYHLEKLSRALREGWQMGNPYGMLGPDIRLSMERLSL